jgi:hypothetical protein
MSPVKSFMRAGKRRLSAAWILAKTHSRPWLRAKHGGGLWKAYLGHNDRVLRGVPINGLVHDKLHRLDVLGALAEVLRHVVVHLFKGDAAGREVPVAKVVKRTSTQRGREVALHRIRRRLVDTLASRH